MEYSLQIDLAICLNTEYVWTRRTKKVIKYLYLMAFLLFRIVALRGSLIKTDAPPYGKLLPLK
jgi:hypothetical protein